MDITPDANGAPAQYEDVVKRPAIRIPARNGKPERILFDSKFAMMPYQDLVDYAKFLGGEITHLLFKAVYTYESTVCDYHNCYRPVVHNGRCSEHTYSRAHRVKA